MTTARSEFWNDAEAARVWARWMLAHDKLAVLDTETTGLDNEAEVVSVAAIARDGRVLLDTRVRPVYPVPLESRQVHGIHNADLVNAPTFADVYPQLRYIFGAFHVAVYNAAFDERVIRHCCELAGLPPLYGPPWNCVMSGFAAYWGDWSEYHQSFTWKRLEHAAYHAGYKPIKAHDALDDCRATLAVLEYMAEGR